MKIAGVVILYNPDEDLQARIESYLQILEALYVFDNTELLNDDIKNKLSGIPKVKYSHDEENKGISFRLNQAAELALKEGFDLLLTMDQDSYFDKGVAEKYKTCFINYNEFSKTAMFGLEFIKDSPSAICSPEKVSELITSGSIVNLNLYNKIGDFDENLFIDYVDHEYCYRAQTKGYELIKFSNIFLQHAIGSTQQKRSIASFKNTQRSFHSSTRIYYMVRNYLYVNAKYKNSFPQELKNQRNSILTRIKNKLLYNTNRIKLLKLIFRAYKDYKSGRMGKIS